MYPYKGLVKSPSQNKFIPIEPKKCENCNYETKIENDVDWGFFVDLETLQFVRNMVRSNYNRYMNTINEDDEYTWDDDNNDKPYIEYKNEICSKTFWKELFSFLKQTNSGIMIVMNIKGVIATAACFTFTFWSFFLLDKYSLIAN